jgi:predicted RNase H-like HicB family nuclease
MRRFLVVIEPTDTGFSAYSPDIPGCVATGATREETEQKMHEAIPFHVDGLREDRLSIPESRSFAEYMAVA